MLERIRYIKKNKILFKKKEIKMWFKKKVLNHKKESENLLRDWSIS